MYIIAAAIAVHCWYLAKSKGYSPKLVAALAFPLIFLAVVFKLIGLIPVALLWLVLVLLKTKPNAAGDAYFTITLICPECAEEIHFKRSREGCAELCPECGEIVNVPTDEGIAPPKGLEELTADITGPFGASAKLPGATIQNPSDKPHNDTT